MWQIDQWPIPTFHVFLSHCREDRGWLVEPLIKRLARRGILAWYDQQNYPRATDAAQSLQDGLIKCRHAVFLSSHDYLEQPRGWNHWELAFATVIQANLQSQIPLTNFILPIGLIDRTDPSLAGTAWQFIEAPRWMFCPRTCRSTSPARDRATAVGWAADQITRFVYEQQDYARDVEQRIHTNPFLRMDVEGPGPGLIHDQRRDRILLRDNLHI
ncbi:MAG: toll/interleukin-1 receptor domain-containing protein [Candidatus Sumerlaeaceae bacterium]